MSRGAQSVCLYILMGAPLFFLAATGSAQIPPVGLTSLSGAVETGYASTRTVNGRDFSSSILPLGIDLETRGFLGHPDFLIFDVKPQLSAGAQSPQAGFRGGNGVAFDATLLRRRPFPLTIHWSKFNQNLIAFGPLVGLSGIRSTTNFGDFGANWRLDLPRWPRFSAHYGRSNNESQPELAALPMLTTRNTRYGISLTDSRWGWDMRGDVERQAPETETGSIVGTSRSPLAIDQRMTWGNFYARRTFRDRDTVALSTGKRHNALSTNGLPISSDSVYVRGASSHNWGTRWTAALTADYNSNRSDLFGGSILPLAPGATLAPFDSGISTFITSGRLTYKVHENWTLMGGLGRTGVSYRNLATGGHDFPGGAAWSADGGVGFNRNFSWGQFSSSYGLSLTRTPLGQEALRSKQVGHRFSSQYRRGSVDKLELTGLVTANINTIEREIFLQTENFIADFSLGRRMAGYVVRAGVGWQQSRHENLYDFSSRGISTHAGLEHSRFRVNYSRNANRGTSFFLEPGLSDESVLPGVPLLMLLSYTKSDNFSVYLTPARKLQVATQWSRLRQELGPQLDNKSDYFNVAIGYGFRLLQFDVGYAIYDQTIQQFGSVYRGSYFVRIRRPFRLF